jgi:hypothetical protein
LVLFGFTEWKEVRKKFFKSFIATLVQDYIKDLDLLGLVCERTMRNNLIIGKTTMKVCGFQDLHNGRSLGFSLEY